MGGGGRGFRCDARPRANAMPRWASKGPVLNVQDRTFSVWGGAHKLGKSMTWRIRRANRGDHGDGAGTHGDRLRCRRGGALHG